MWSEKSVRSFENPKQNSENMRVVSMNPTVEASELIRRAAEPRPVGDSVKAAITRAARRVGLGYERAKAIWYAEARRVDASEMDRLRAVAAERARRQEEAGIDAHRELVDRITAIEARLAALDADISGRGSAAGRLRCGLRVRVPGEPSGSVDPE